MGVSVKTGDTPIGFFGTGLKYAIATLLRSKHDVALIRNGERFTFTGRTESIRGEDFDIVYMNDQKLGFTTAMGPNWTAVEAYRELASNCIDEGGEIGYNAPDETHKTVFEIRGEGINDARKDHADMFLQGKPMLTTDDMDVYRGDTTKVYYRGVKAGFVAKPFMHTYCLKTETTLTEDRTIKYPWYVTDALARLVSRSHDYNFIKKCLMAPTGYGESDIEIREDEIVSVEFLKVVANNSANLNMNYSAIKRWEKTKPTKALFKNAKLDEFDKDTIGEALSLLRQVGVNLERKDFIVSTELTGALGMVRDGDIVIAKNTVDQGVRRLASTLYEEWMHKTKGIDDYTRAFQDHVLDGMFSLAEKLKRTLDKRG
jgi:hypothetical protein